MNEVLELAGILGLDLTGLNKEMKLNKIILSEQDFKYGPTAAELEIKAEPIMQLFLIDDEIRDPNVRERETNMYTKEEENTELKQKNIAKILALTTVEEDEWKELRDLKRRNEEQKVKWSEVQAKRRRLKQRERKENMTNEEKQTKLLRRKELRAEVTPDQKLARATQMRAYRYQWNKGKTEKEREKERKRKKDFRAQMTPSQKEEEAKKRIARKMSADARRQRTHLGDVLLKLEANKNC